MSRLLRGDGVQSDPNGQECAKRVKILVHPRVVGRDKSVNPAIPLSIGKLTIRADGQNYGGRPAVHGGVIPQQLLEDVGRS